MNWYEAEVRELEKAIAARGLISPVVFYGSSSIRLWSTLEQDLGESNVLNLGFGGSTLEACAYFFHRLVGAAKPRSLVVYAGDNDLGDGRNPSQVFGYFQLLAAGVAAIKTAGGSGLPFGYVSIKPSPARAGIIDRIWKTNALISAEIERTPGAYYIDTFHSMLQRDGRPRAELFQDDGLHLNEHGYRLWAQTMLDHKSQIFG